MLPEVHRRHSRYSVVPRCLVQQPEPVGAPDPPAVVPAVDRQLPAAQGGRLQLLSQVVDSSSGLSVAVLVFLTPPSAAHRGPGPSGEACWSLQLEAYSLGNAAATPRLVFQDSLAGCEANALLPEPIFPQDLHLDQPVILELLRDAVAPLVPRLSLAAWATAAARRSAGPLPSLRLSRVVHRQGVAIHWGPVAARRLCTAAVSVRLLDAAGAIRLVALPSSPRFRGRVYECQASWAQVVALSPQAGNIAFTAIAEPRGASLFRRLLQRACEQLRFELTRQGPELLLHGQRSDRPLLPWPEDEAQARLEAVAATRIQTRARMRRDRSR